MIDRIGGGDVWSSLGEFFSPHHQNMPQRAGHGPRGVRFHLTSLTLSKAMRSIVTGVVCTTYFVHDVCHTTQSARLDSTRLDQHDSKRSRMSRRNLRDDDDDELDDAVVHADIPNTFRELRACMTCSLIKTFTQFYDTGCENCAFLQMADNRTRVAECTSAYFEGCVLALVRVCFWATDLRCSTNASCVLRDRMIAMMQPKESWVAKWQRIGASR